MTPTPFSRVAALLTLTTALALLTGCGSKPKPGPDDDDDTSGGSGTTTKPGSGPGAGKAGGGSGVTPPGGTTGGDPILPPGPTPEQQRRKAESTALRQLVGRALKKDTGAIDELEKTRPKLHAPVVTLAVEAKAGSLKEACDRIAQLGPDVAGAAVPVYDHTVARAKEFSRYEADSVLAAAAACATRIGPDEADLLDDSRLPALARTPDGKDAKGNPIDRSAARLAGVKGLGEMAVHCVAQRPVVVDLLLGAAKENRLKAAAVRGLANCGTAAGSAPALEELKKLKLDESADVRREAGLAVAEVQRQLEFVPHLERAGVHEGQVERPLFLAAFQLVEKNDPAGLDKLLADRPPAVIQALLGLSGLTDGGGKDFGPVRGAALDRLLGVVESTPEWRAKLIPALVARPLPGSALERLGVVAYGDAQWRPQVIPAFIAALDRKGETEAALKALARCGPEGVVALREKKSPHLEAVEPHLREIALKSGGTDACLALAELKPKQPATIDGLVELVHKTTFSEGGKLVKVEESHVRAAGKALNQLKPEDMAGPGDAFLKHHMDFNNIRWNKPAAREEESWRLLKQMGLNPSSELDLYASVLAHPHVTPKRKQTTVGMIVNQIELGNSPANYREKNRAVIDALTAAKAVEAFCKVQWSGALVEGEWGERGMVAKYELNQFRRAVYLFPAEAAAACKGDIEKYLRGLYAGKMPRKEWVDHFRDVYKVVFALAEAKRPEMRTALELISNNDTEFFRRDPNFTGLSNTAKQYLQQLGGK